MDVVVSIHIQLVHITDDLDEGILHKVVRLRTVNKLEIYLVHVSNPIIAVKATSSLTEL